ADFGCLLRNHGGTQPGRWSADPSGRKPRARGKHVRSVSGDPMRRTGSALTPLAIGLLCVRCTGWQSAFDAGGVQALHLEHLMTFIMIVCAAVWALVVLVLIAALWRRRQVRSEPLAFNARVQHRLS